MPPPIPPSALVFPESEARGVAMFSALSAAIVAAAAARDATLLARLAAHVEGAHGLGPLDSWMLAGCARPVGTVERLALITGSVTATHAGVC